MRISADFVTSAAGASDLPRDARPAVVLVGRSNVGKSSLINALARQRIARASAAPGKTRLANVYRVRRGGGAPVYLVDLPGYGYAGGGAGAARTFEALTGALFGPSGRPSRPGRPETDGVPRGGLVDGALLLVDARHPGLESDLAAWRWLAHSVPDRTIVATKIDKLPRGQRIRAVRECESVFDDSVLPVSAVTGEGLDELWNQIDRLVNSLNPQPRRSRSSPRPPRATAARLPKN